MATTIDQYYDKLLAIAPSDWFLDGVLESIYIGHLRGMAAILNHIHQAALDHKEQLFLTKANNEFLEAHADERVIPSLGFIDENRVDQIQKLGSRASLAKIKDVVDRLLRTGDSIVMEGFVLDPNDPGSYPGQYLSLDYGDRDEQIIDWLGQENVFTIIIRPQNVPSFSFLNRDIFLDSGSVLGSAESTVAVGRLLMQALSVYKAAGFRFRIIEQSGVYAS